MEQWEYRSHLVNEGGPTVDEQKKALDPWLNELGGQGWELVGAAASGASGLRYQLFFKRRVGE